MGIEIANMIERMMLFVWLVPLGYTVFYFSPRYYNFSKYKSMQLIFLIGFLLLGILFIPTIFNRVISAQNTSILYIFMVYDSVILFLTFYLFKGKIDTTTVFFVTVEDLKKLMDGVLRRIGWDNIQLTEEGLDSIEFSAPNQNFTVVATKKEDRFIVSPVIVDENQKVDTEIIRRFNMNLKFDTNKYPSDASMVAIFRRKNLIFLVILWGIFVVFQIARVVLA